MEMDELRLAWQQVDRKLDQVIEWKRRLERTGSLHRVKTPLRQLAVSLVFEGILAICALILLGYFIAANFRDARFVLPAALLDAWNIACLAAVIRQLIGISQIDYEKPILDVQRQLERLRVSRLRILRWALITGQAVWWLPLLIVVLRGIFGVDVYQAFSPLYLYVNAAFSIVVLALSIWFSAKMSRQESGPRLLRALAGHIAGRHIDRALASLRSLSAFESEPV
jgi:hypothetical protein